MLDHTDVGDDAQEVALVAVVQFDSLVIAGRQQNLGTGALPVLLLVLVQGLLEELVALRKHKFIQFWKIGGIVAYRVFDQEYGLDAHLEYVVAGVEAVLIELDDGKNQVGISVPAEDVVHAGVLTRRQFPVNLSRIMHKQDERSGITLLLHFLSQGENIPVVLVVHTNDHIKTVIIKQFPSICRSVCPDEGRRIAEVQVHIFLGDAGLDASVLLHYESVVIAAYHKDAAYPVTYEGLVRLVVQFRFLTYFHNLSNMSILLNMRVFF